MQKWSTFKFKTSKFLAQYYPITKQCKNDLALIRRNKRHCVIIIKHFN